MKIISSTSPSVKLASLVAYIILPEPKASLVAYIIPPEPKASLATYIILPEPKTSLVACTFGLIYDFGLQQEHIKDLNP